jgi:hypothetical protein
MLNKILAFAEYLLTSPKAEDITDKLAIGVCVATILYLTVAIIRVL